MMDGAVPAMAAAAKRCREALEPVLQKLETEAKVPTPATPAPPPPDNTDKPAVPIQP